MGGIVDKHVEWAVVNRLRAMLDEPPKTKFNVTQSFALLSAILLWTKNRAWVGGNRMDRPHWFDAADHAARDAREELRKSRICEAPWLLSRTTPQIAKTAAYGSGLAEDINTDFVKMTAEAFFEWLRNALAHGDGRTIRPLHKQSMDGKKTFLSGFEIVFPERMGAPRQLTLALHNADMRRIGAILADQFCHSLSGDSRYFEQEVGTADIEEISPRAAGAR